MTKYKIAVAGSSKYSKICAQALLKDKQIEIPWIITPAPKKVGRKQQLTENSFHNWAEKQNLPVYLVKQKIEPGLRQALPTRPDLLLVVDFGYLIPNWLLNWVRKGAVNIHPSKLPRWRGSSPGQMILLYGEKQTAVTLFKLTDKLDQGPIIYQEDFTVANDWTQVDYYQYSYHLITDELAELLSDYLAGELEAKPQKESSPTPVTYRFTKEDGFVPWVTLAHSMGRSIKSVRQTLRDQDSGSKLGLLIKLIDRTQQKDWPRLLERASRAFYPWPGLWTKIPTNKGWRQMKIISSRVHQDSKQSPSILQLDQVKIAGKQTASWNEVKNAVK